MVLGLSNLGYAQGFRVLGLGKLIGVRPGFSGLGFWGFRVYGL